MRTFLFYDTETSGLNPAFDQILTFAAIRTDLNLTEIDRYTITIRLRNDIVPSPKAFLTHGLTFEELKEGICEYDAAKLIHKIVNEPGTISLGYNTLGFDDDFLRFLFYRNLLDPYTHQYSQGCMRMDILPIAAVYRLFCPDVLEWPTVDGRVSLKLENISQQNNFIISGRAHEAISDVEAVIELSKAFRQNMDIWSYTLDFFVKVKDEVRVNNIKKDFSVQGRDFRVCLMISTSFGSANNFLAPVIHLGESMAYKNQSIWLRLDMEDALGIKSSCDISETMVIRKRPADAYILLPFLERFQNKVTDKAKKLLEENLKCIQEDWVRFFEIIQYHCEYKYPKIPNLDTDASLYQSGFFSKQEKVESRRFHQAAFEHKINAIEKMQCPRTKMMASRILHRNFSRDLNFVSTEGDWSSYLGRLKSDDQQARVVGYKSDFKRCVPEAMAELKDAAQELSDPNQDQQEMLLWLGSYLSEL